MDLKFFKPRELSSSAKITVHKTGKMGFSKGAIEMLDIERNLYVKFGNDDSGKLYMLMSNKEDSEVFNIVKAGEYYYFKAKSLLEDLNVDYKSGDTTIYDIKKTEDSKVYELIKRVIHKKK